MKRLFYIIVLFLPAISAMAQQTITGKVADSATRQAIEFANVALLRAGESVPASGATTDIDGEFFLTNIPDGNYKAVISFMGYNTREINVVVNGKQVDLGRITLKENTQDLQEVEVVAQGSQMRFELDKKVFSVDQSIAAAGGSISDVLENIPSVEVDVEGNISLRNSDAVEIWINGKPAGLTAENRAQILQQMPAGSIKEIEVITNPSAKYSPEGTAGIINLVMKKDRQAGYYGSVTGRINYSLAKPWTTPPGGELGLNFNFSKGIVDGYFNAGYHYHMSNGYTINDRYNFMATDTTRLKKDGRRQNHGGGLFLRGGLDFRITERSTIGISGFGIVESNNDKTKGFFSNKGSNPVHYELYDVTKYYDPQDDRNEQTLIRSYDRDEESRGSHPGGNVMIDWRFEPVKSHSLSMSAQYADFQWNGTNFYTQRDYDIATNAVTSESVQEQDSKNRDRGVQLKADYEWKPTAASRLEAGWQTDLNWRSTLADAWNGDRRAEQLQAYYNDFRNNEQTHALYITYGNRFWDKLAVQVGLRGELFVRHLESTYYNSANTLETASMDTTYFQLFPSVYISYSFDNGHELQANYTRRVDRPRGHQINPRQDFSDSTNIRYGNPALLPQYSSAVELNYLKTWERHVLSAGLFYRFADHVRQNIKYTDNTGLMRNTFVNLGTRHEAGVELVAKNKFWGEHISLTTTLNFYYNRMDKAYYTPTLNGVTYDEVVIPVQNIFVWSARLNIGLMFTKTFMAQIAGQYSSPRVQAQGQSSHRYNIDISLRKTFLNRQLALALNVRDLLNSRSRKNTSYSDTFWQFQDNQWNGRMISLSLTYNFGNMKKNKNEKRPDNSDYDSGDSWGEGSDE